MAEQALQMKEDRIAGKICGLVLGDVYGAPHEGGFAERALWWLLGRCGGKRRWTDDTQMTLDVIASLLALGHIDQADLASRFAKSYRWSRGYGPGAATILRRHARCTDRLVVCPCGQSGDDRCRLP